VAAVSGGQASGYPRIARVGNELIFAWTDSAIDASGALQIQTAATQLP
jgi:hypothetical protein